MNNKSNDFSHKNFVSNSHLTGDVLLINQTAIARELKISQGYVSMIIAGKRHSKNYEPRIKNLIKKAAEELRAV